MTEFQLIWIGIAASAIVWLLKLTKKQISAGWLTTLVYVVSLGLAYVFAPLVVPGFPPFVDAVSFGAALLAWSGDLLLAISPFVGFATLVYNALLKAVLDKYVKPLFARFTK